MKDYVEWTYCIVYTSMSVRSPVSNRLTSFFLRSLSNSLSISEYVHCECAVYVELTHYTNIKYIPTVCLRGLDSFYLVTYYTKRVKTSWTYST